MAGDDSGVVDDKLKFLAYDHIYACDNSVFPPRRQGIPASPSPRSHCSWQPRSPVAESGRHDANRPQRRTVKNDGYARGQN